MRGALVRSILILPGNVLVVVPMILLALTRDGALAWQVTDWDGWQLWATLPLVALGLVLMVATMRLFASVGDGTPAPWNPPKKLVLRGVYRHVRNPMISGVIFALLAEALYFRSWAIAGWAVLFALGNMIYMPLFEEPGLEKRFGADYRVYKENVPRWLPRWKPWDGLSSG